MEFYSKQIRFMCKYKLETADAVDELKTMKLREKQIILNKRNKLYYHRNKCNNEEDRDAITKNIILVTDMLKKVKKEIKLCDVIYNNVPKILSKLLEIGKKIELIMEEPQDIEWGIDEKNNIYIFQSRPIIINKRNINKFQKIATPQNCIIGNSISNGFAIGRINQLENYSTSEIILQSGKLTSKDLITIINSKAILLQTGGYLSHFANIIREFYKPSIIIKETQALDLNEPYIVDGYNGYLYKLNDLNLKQQKKAYWNYFVDLIYNGNKIYLDTIGIKSYRFILKHQNKEYDILDYITIGNKLYIDSDNEMLEIEFSSINLLNKFIANISKKGDKNEKIYRCK